MATVEKYKKLLEELGTDSEEGKRLIEILSRASCSDNPNNAPIVAITDFELGGNTAGVYKKRFVRINPAHAERLVQPDVPNEEKIRVLQTVYHENTHDRQFRDYGDVRTFFRYLQLKIKALIRAGKVSYNAIYYKENLSEREAFLEAAKKALEYVTDSGLDVNLREIIRQIAKEYAIIDSFYEGSFKIPDWGMGNLKRSLSNLFDKHIEKKMYRISRTNLERDYGITMLQACVVSSAAQKYINDPELEIDIDDYKPGICILKDNPSLRIEYTDQGKKRSFKDFLLNAKSLLGKQKFKGSKKKARIMVDRDLANLIKDIAYYDYMRITDLSEMIFGLSHKDAAFNENDSENQNDLYRDVILGITKKALPKLIKKATEKMNIIPKVELENLKDMFMLLHEYRKKDEERVKRKDFFEGLESIDEETGKTVLQLLDEFEVKVDERLKAIGNNEKGEGNRSSGGIGIGED